MRYKKYNYIIKNYQISKFQTYQALQTVTLKSIELQAGHFKPTSTFVEHGLLLSNIVGQAPVLNIYKHGKRLRTTAILKTSIKTKWKWAVLDKFLSSFLPAISDLKEYKNKKSESSMYSWRIRNFFEWTDTDPLLSERIIKKDVFLPLFFNTVLTQNSSQKQNEDMLRMLRIPVSLVR